MTHEGAPALFVIHEVTAVRAAIQGAMGDASTNSIIRPILKSPAEQRCPREERPRKRASPIML
jgi:hypothetical protein